MINTSNYREEIRTIKLADNELADKAIALKQLLERLCKEATQSEAMQFSTLFSRIVFIAQKYNLSKKTEWELQNFRVKVKQQVRNQSNQIARECMVSALMQLLETKPLSTISVTEITKKAGVSRMTYYRNYHSKEEIFSSYLEDIIASYRADASARNMEGSYNDQRHMQHCFQYFYTHKDFIRCLIKSAMCWSSCTRTAAATLKVFLTAPKPKARLLRFLSPCFP